MRHPVFRWVEHQVIKPCLLKIWYLSKASKMLKYKTFTISEDIKKFLAKFGVFNHIEISQKSDNDSYYSKTSDLSNVFFSNSNGSV